MPARFLQNVMLLLLVAISGCGHTAHANLKWKAEDYFDDPQVIALCRAIEADDIPEIDRLIAAGVDINHQGKGKMTPLMWAFPGNKLDRFKRLLEHGADPNVITDKHVGPRGEIPRGTSVTHMASESTFPGYFDAVFAHGGDPNLEHPERSLGAGFTPLFDVIMSSAPDKGRRIRLLLAKGADINHHSPGGDTAAMWALGRNQFDIVLMLLEAGADFMLVPNDYANTRLMHQMIIIKGNGTASWTPTQLADYDTVIDWLEAHGDSRAEAQRDLERWDTWSRDTGEYKRKMAAEVAARKEREAGKKQQPNPVKQPEE